MVYLYIKKKIGLLERGVFFFCSAANVGDFCSFKDYGAGANRPQIQTFVQKYISHFRSNKLHFCTYLGRGFNIPECKGN